jgi:AraC-like DNA-binding protein
MIYIIGIVIAFFLDFLLISKKNKSTADKILAAWLFVIGLHLGLYYAYFSNTIYQFPSVLGVHIPFPLLHGPFLYLYTLFATNQASAKKGVYLLHFLPVFAIYAYLIPFFKLPDTEKIYVLQNEGIGYEVFMTVVIALICTSGVVYTILSLIVLKKHKQSILNQFSHIEKINFNWLQYLIFGLAFVWIIVLSNLPDTILFGAVAVFVFFLGYFGIKQVGIFSNIPSQMAVNMAENNDFIETNTDIDNTVRAIETPAKYLKSGLNTETLEDIHKSLSIAMDKDELFKNAELTLTSLANHLGINPNYLSQVINQMEGKNFYDYINTLRIEAFKEMVANPNNQKYTLLALAYDCGFNSKTSFNRHFKKMTGFSPSEYLKNYSLVLE